MYKSSAPQGGEAGAPGAAGSDGAHGAAPGAEKPKDNVVDAEFVDVDEKK